MNGPTDRIGQPEPGAKAAIDAVAAGSAELLLMTVDGFITDDEAKRLRNLLWYARQRNMSVQFVPLAGAKPQGIRCD